MAQIGRRRRISFPIPIVFLDSCTIFNCPDVGQETREKRMEGSVCAQHTHAVTGIGARVRVSIIAPVVRCLSFVIVRGPFVVTRENDSYTWVIRRGGRVTNVHARVRGITWDTVTAFPEWGNGA